MTNKNLCNQNAARREKVFLYMSRDAYLIYLYCENGQDASSCNIFWKNSVSQKTTFLLLPLYFGKALLANFSTKVFPLLWISTLQVTGTTETTEAIVLLSQYYCQQRHSYVPSAPCSWLCQQHKHSHGHTISQIREPILGTTNQEVEKGKKASYHPTQMNFHTWFTGHLLERWDGRINN